jgi:O-antigen ligase
MGYGERVLPWVALGGLAFGSSVLFVFVMRSPMLASALVAVVCGVFFMVRWPQAGTLCVLFVLYSNIGVVAVQSHDAGQAATAADLSGRSFLLGSLCIVLFIPLAYYLLALRERIVIDRTFVAMLFLLVAILASSIFAQDKLLAGKYILDYCLEGILMFLLVTNVIRDIPTLKRAIAALVLAGAFMGGLAIFQEVTHTTKDPYWGLAQRGSEVEAVGQQTTTARAAGPIGEQNRFAQILLLLMPLSFFMLRQARTRFTLLSVLAAIAMIVGGIVLTFSRGGFVTLIMLFGMIVAFRLVRIRHAAIAAVIATLIVLPLEPYYVQRILSIGQLGSLVSSGNRPVVDNGAALRLAENLAALQVFVDHPLLGVGPGHFSKYYSSDYANRSGLARQEKNYRSHNLYLEIMAELGIVGLVCFLSLVGGLIIGLWRVRQKTLARDPELSDLSAAALLMLAAYLVSGVFLHLSYIRYFWMIIAIAAVTLRCLREREGSEPRRYVQVA